ncbi:MAG: dipeptidase [Bacteroidota bacterium]
MKSKNFISQKFSFLIFSFLISSCATFRAVDEIPIEIKNFHNESILVDTHNDLMIRIVEKNEDLSNETKLGHSDIPRFKKGGVDLQILSVWLDPKFEKSNPFAQTSLIFDSVHSFVSKNKNKVVFVKNYDEAISAIQQKKLGVLIGVEGGHPIENDLSKLKNLFNRGMRYMAFTWNNSTNWATSARDEFADSLNEKPKGLTDFGKSVVRKMNELGILIDVSHVGAQSVNDILEASEDPIIASHSCVYNIAPHFRNLKDDQIKAIAKKEGVIFLNFYAGFLDVSFQKKYSELYASKKNIIDSLHNAMKDSMKVEFLVWDMLKSESENLLPPISVLIDHIDYIKNLVGSVDNIGFGADFDGADNFPKGIVDVTSYPKITNELFLRGYTKEEIKKILGGNFLRVFRKVCG